MNCKGCHASRCYKHILSTYSIHSSVALTAHLADDGSAIWHSVHRDVRDEYAKEYPRLKVAVKHGMPYPRHHRLAYYASEFAVKTPISEATRLGFYDAGVPENRDVSSTPFSCANLIVPQGHTARASSLPQRTDMQAATNTVSERTDISGIEGTSSRNQRNTRSRALPNPGPSTSKKRSLSPQEDENIPQKRPRTLRPAMSTRTDGVTAGLAAGRPMKARQAKAKLSTRTSKKARGPRRCVSSAESSSVSFLQSYPDISHVQVGLWGTGGSRAQPGGF